MATGITIGTKLQYTGGDESGSSINDLITFAGWADRHGYTEGEIRLALKEAGVSSVYGGIEEALDSVYGREEDKDEEYDPYFD